jgi:hypothetical protein
VDRTTATKGTVGAPWLHGAVGVSATIFALATGCGSNSAGGGPVDTNDAGAGNTNDATVGGSNDGGGDAKSSVDSGNGSSPDGSVASGDSSVDGGSSIDAGEDASDGAIAALSPLPCDIYGEAGTNCVAAHSTTRALYATYSGKLYRVRRASDNATLDIGTLSPGGYADSAAQDTFCAGTTCIIAIIYDQSPMGNDLGISPGGGAVSTPDVGAVATVLPAIAGGHKVYAVYVSPGTGYRNLAAVGTATGGEPEGMYMVTSTQNVNNGCCFDYGNTEQPHATDNGNGHMDAVNFSTTCGQQPCTGSGPWVQADLENGLFGGNGSNLNNQPITTYDLVTAMLKNDGQTTFR